MTTSNEPTETGARDRRQYGELCPIALALDVVGERWALLLLRELFAGPKRFTDLAEGLPGIGTSVLAERLRQLENDGLVSRRRLGPPARAQVYELTARGAALKPVLAGLVTWGSVYLVGKDADLSTRGRWLLQAMAITAGTLPRGIVTTNFVLDGEESSLVVTKEGVEARDGLDSGAQLTIRGTARDLHRIATSANKGKARSKPFIVDGDRRSADRLLGHLAEGIRRAAAAPVDSAHLPKGGGPRISMPPFRAAEARTRSKSTGADASRAGVSVSLAPR